MGEIISIVSGKGGVGKTTIAANVSAALALMGKKVVVIDTDIGLRNLDIALGMENKIVYDLVDVLEGVCRIKQALVKDKRFEDLYLMPSSQTREKNTITSVQMKVLCKKLKEKYDYVIVDAPPGIDNGYKNAVEGADSVIVVTTPEPATVRDADRIIRDLKSRDMDRIMLVINKNQPELIRRGILLEIDYILNTLKTEIIGILSKDEHVFVSMNCGEPIAFKKGTKFERIFSHMAERIEGQSIPLFNK